MVYQQIYIYLTNTDFSNVIILYKDLVICFANLISSFGCLCRVDNLRDNLIPQTQRSSMVISN